MKTQPIDLEAIYRAPSAVYAPPILSQLEPLFTGWPTTVVLCADGKAYEISHRMAIDIIDSYERRGLTQLEKGELIARAPPSHRALVALYLRAIPDQNKMPHPYLLQGAKKRQSL